MSLVLEKEPGLDPAAELNVKEFCRNELESQDTQASLIDDMGALLCASHQREVLTGL